jgi:hypothetical protein
MSKPQANWPHYPRRTPRSTLGFLTFASRNHCRTNSDTNPDTADRCDDMVWAVGDRPQHIPEQVRERQRKPTASRSTTPLIEAYNMAMIEARTMERRRPASGRAEKARRAKRGLNGACCTSGVDPTKAARALRDRSFTLH